MRRFYLDTEYTNGNYYTGDIFEVAVLSEKTGYIFHAYIAIRYKLSPFIEKLCNISNRMLDMESQPFNVVMDDLIDFINQESIDEQPTIIAHGGHLSDFPLLLANCMKATYDCTRLAMYRYIDSMKVLQDKGYEKPGLDTFSTTTTRRHSAVDDVKVLKHVVNTLLLQDINTSSQHTYTLDEIFHYLIGKLPLKIYQLYGLVAQAKSRYTLEVELFKHVAKKTALSEKQIRNVSLYYYYYNK